MRILIQKRSEMNMFPQFAALRHDLRVFSQLAYSQIADMAAIWE